MHRTLGRETQPCLQTHLGCAPLFAFPSLYYITVRYSFLFHPAANVGYNRLIFRLIFEKAIQNVPGNLQSTPVQPPNLRILIMQALANLSPRHTHNVPHLKDVTIPDILDLSQYAVS